MSQTKRVYQHLQTKGTITNAQAHNLYGIRHLPSVIRDIKKEFNVSIYDWTEHGKNRFGEKCWWKVYSLYEKEEPKTA